MASSDDRVCLLGGPRLPGAVVALAVDLVARGFSIKVRGDRVLVGPVDRLTPDDVQAIRRWRDDLRALVTYVDGWPAVPKHLQ